MKIIDDSHMTVTLFSPTCSTCKHLKIDPLKGLSFCAAFPKEIPNEIWTGENDHRQPYPGDKGIIYEEVDSGNRL